MTVTLLDPDGLVQVDAVRQVSVATGSKLVFVAGQVAWRPDGTTVGVGDLAAHVEQCHVYVVDWSLDKMPLFEDGVARATRRLGVDPPRAPGSLIGISAGFTPDLLVEVEALAVLDGGTHP